MKIDDTVVCLGQRKNGLQYEEIQKSKKQKKSFFAGNWNREQDVVITKKKMAQQKAMKIVGDTFAAEQKIDKQQESRREKVKELLQQACELKEYKKSYEMLPEDEMTEEMKEDSADAIVEYQKQYDATMQEIKSELFTIEAVKRARSKSSAMQDAHEQADDIMAAASEEITKLLFEEAKEHIDGEQKAREEKAEKIAEEKKAEEEILEESQEKKAETAEIKEAIQQTESGDLQKEIEEMLAKLKLLDEDLKGAAIDTNI